MDLCPNTPRERFWPPCLTRVRYERQGIDRVRTHDSTDMRLPYPGIKAQGTSMANIDEGYSVDITTVDGYRVLHASSDHRSHQDNPLE